MSSSRYVTGRVCQVVAGDTVKCTKMASVHEKNGQPKAVWSLMPSGR